MNGKFKVLFFIFIAISFLAGDALAEEVTLKSIVSNTTRGRSGAIGTNYRDTDMASQADNLIVEGKVGIGTNSPTIKLDVVGDVKVSGKLTIQGGMTLSSSGGTSMLGASSVKSINTTYTAETDGLVVVYVNNGGASTFNAADLTGYVNSVPMAYVGCEWEGSRGGSFTMPVRKGSTWKVGGTVQYNVTYKISWNPIG